MDTGIYLIQGPPGTGKTTTLLGIITMEYEKNRNKKNSIDNKQKLLVCTPSNSAIKLISNKLSKEGILQYKEAPVYVEE